MGFGKIFEFQKNILVRSGFDKSKFFIKPNYHPDIPLVTPWGDRDNSFVFVGRLSPEKGIDNLIEAWRILGDSAPILHVIGHGPSYNQLLEAAKSLNIIVHGFLDNPEKEKILNSSKVLLVPSNWFEGQPATLIEAMARGLAVGVSNVGPLPSFVDYGESGFIFEPGNGKSLAASIAALADKDEILYRYSLSSRKKFISNYTKDVCMTNLEEIYESVI
jgi:glycosyltransferase involved in cell wall biosynthesis